MTFFDAGLVVARIGDQHPELKGTARHVFAVMASMVGGSERDKTDPVCFASQHTIAERAGYGVRTVSRTLAELERVGAIKAIGRAGPRLHATVRWSLPLLPCLSAKMADKHDPEQQSAKMADKQSAKMADKQSAKMADNPSDLQRPPGSAREEDRGAADAAASAGATAAAAAPSTSPSPSGTAGIVGEVMAQRGCSTAAAESWIERKLAAADGAVRNETAYLRKCLEREDQPASPASAKKPTAATGKKGKKKSDAAGVEEWLAKNGEDRKAQRKPPRGVPSAAQTKAARDRRRNRNHVPADEVSAAVTASRSGEAHKQIAERMNVTPSAVDYWRSNADRSESLAAVAEGQPVEEVAQRFGMAVNNLRATHERHMWSDVATALKTGESIPAVVKKLNVSIGFVEQLAHTQRVRPDVVAELRLGAPVKLVAAKFSVDPDFVYQVRLDEDRRQAHEQRVRGDIAAALSRGESTDLLIKVYSVTTEFVERVQQQEAERAERERKWAEQREQERERAIRTFRKRNPW